MGPTRTFSQAFFLLAATTSVAMTGTAVEAKLSAPEANTKTVRRELQQAITDGFQQAAIQAHEDNDFLSPATLEQIHVITRHVARSMLSKDADSLAEEAGATLTPLGQKQLFELGSWLRENYLDILGQPEVGKESSFAKKSLEYYNPSLHRLESTSLDRTLTSASALSMGLFPSKIRMSGIHNVEPDDVDYVKELFTSPLDNPPSIPIYSEGIDQNDITLRAYRNCPAFHDKLRNTLYTSRGWQAKELENKSLLEKLGRIFPDLAEDGKIPLANVWNVYDPIHVARTECVDRDGEDGDDKENCQPFVPMGSLSSALSSDEFNKLERLTEYTEHLKFGMGLDSSSTAPAGNLLGSNLLWKILNRAKGAGDFFLYSAHAPTILGLLSTLQASEDFYNASGGERFVDYGAALIVEIHKSVDRGSYYFVLKYKSSEKEEAVNVVLKESKSGVKCGIDNSDQPNLPKASWCVLDEVVTWAISNTLTTEEDWCQACNNNVAAVCAAGSSKKKGSSKAQSLIQSSELMGYDGSSTSEATLIICSLFFGGFLAGVLLMGLVWWTSNCCGNGNGKKIANDDAASVLNSSVPVVETEGNFFLDATEGTATTAAATTHASAHDTSDKLNDKEIC